jgi:hypothetical protein
LLCVFLSFLAGISLWHRKKVGPEHILVLFFIGTAMLHMILESQNRYHYNILPIFAILAAVGIVDIFHNYESKTGISKTEENVVLQQELTTTLAELPADQETVEAKNNNFDMLSAIKSGHVTVTVSEEYLKSEQKSEILDE